MSKVEELKEFLFLEIDRCSNNSTFANNTKKMVDSLIQAVREEESGIFKGSVQDVLNEHYKTET